MAQSKKNFMAAAADVFVDKMLTPQVSMGDAPQQKKPARRMAQRNTTAGEVKVCYMLNASIERKVRYIAFAKNIKQKNIITEALQDYIDKYEAANGRIK